MHGHVRHEPVGVAVRVRHRPRAWGSATPTRTCSASCTWCPARARARILDLAATQLASGGAYHQYQPLTKRGNDAIGSGFNDDPLWLVLGRGRLPQGDRRRRDPRRAGALRQHRRHARRRCTSTWPRSLGYTLDRLGPHGLPLIGRADWNDCLNLNCFSRDARRVVPDHGEPRRRRGRVGVHRRPVRPGGQRAGRARGAARAGAARRRSYQAAADKMAGAIVEHGWDGAWFRRAFDYFGAPVGSSENEEGQIFIEPQGICVMSGIGVENGMATRALDSVRERLATEHGIVLLQPRVLAVSPRAGRDLVLPARLQGERRGLLPHQPLGDDRRGHGRPRRRGVRVLPAGSTPRRARRSARSTAASRTCTRR